MRVESVELRRCRLPLREEFRTSHGVETARDVLLVHVRTDAGDGWGECGAPARAGYTDETVGLAHGAQDHNESQRPVRDPGLVGRGNDGRIEQGGGFEGIFFRQIGSRQQPLRGSYGHAESIGFHQVAVTPLQHALDIAVPPIQVGENAFELLLELGLAEPQDAIEDPSNARPVVFRGVAVLGWDEWPQDDPFRLGLQQRAERRHRLSREVASTFDRVWFTTIKRADHLFHLQQWGAVADLLLRFAARTLGSVEEKGWHALEALNSPIDEPSGDGIAVEAVSGRWHRPQPARRPRAGSL